MLYQFSQHALFGRQKGENWLISSQKVDEMLEYVAFVYLLGT